MMPDIADGLVWNVSARRALCSLFGRLIELIVSAELRAIASDHAIAPSLAEDEDSFD